MSPRAIRRAAEHKVRKAANKAALHQTDSPIADFPEPGRPLPLLSEITPARLAANRENSLKSSGPVTEEGKAISSQNRTIHGLARHNGRFALLSTEDPAEFSQLVADFAAEHQPTTPTEVAFVHTMVESLWLRNRAQNLQVTCFNADTGQVIDQPSLALYIRYENSYQRAFANSVSQLLKLRAEQRKTHLGFEAQRIKNEQHQMKKDAHYWDILKKDAETCHELGRNLIQKTDATQQNPDFISELADELTKRHLKPALFGTAIAA